MRGSETTKYLKDRYAKKKEVADNKSCLSKCGSMLKTIIVFGVVAAVGIPMLYELYTKFMNDGQKPQTEYEIITTKRDEKP